MKLLIKWSLIIITLLIFLYAFSSSYNSQNIDHLDYVIALCVDSVPDSDNLKVSFEFANLGSFAENSSSQDSEPIINSIIAPSISSAINIMNGYIGKQLNLSHCKVIVLSKDYAKRSILNDISFLTHNIQIRPTTNIIISDGEAVNYLKSSISSLEQVLTKYYDVFPTSSEYTGYTANIPLGKFYENLQNKDVGTVTILGKTIQSQDENKTETSKQSSSEAESQNSNPTNSESSSSSKSSESESSKEKVLNDTDSKNVITETTINNKQNFQSINPQEAIVEGDRGTENMGLAVFKDDKYIGELSTIETLCYSLIKDEVDNFLVTMTNPFDETQKIDIYAGSLSELNLDIDVSRNNPIINIKLNLTAEVLNVLSKPNLSYEETLEKLDNNFKQYLEKELKDYLYKTSREYKTDISEFYKQAKHQFLTNTDFNNYKWNEKFENAEFNIEFNNDIISTLIIQQD